MPHETKPSAAAAEVFAFYVADRPQDAYDRVRNLAREHPRDRVVGLCAMAVMACAGMRPDFNVGLDIVMRGGDQPVRSAAAQQFWDACAAFTFDRWQERSHYLAPRVERWMEQSRARLRLVANPNLREWHEQIERYVTGTTTQADFVAHLFPASDRSATVHAYIITVALERKIDFDAADSEHGAFLELLWPTLEPTESQRFIEVGMSARQGNIATSEYHDLCKRMARAKNIDTTTFPQMLNYFEYSKSAEEVSLAAVFKATWHAIADGYAQRVKSQVEAKAVADFLEWYLVERVLSETAGGLNLVRISRRRYTIQEKDRAMVQELVHRKQRQAWARRLRRPVAIATILALALVALVIVWGVLQ
jgi:hypothetical protein